jgi:hypothetical protein
MRKLLLCGVSAFALSACASGQFQTDLQTAAGDLAKGSGAAATVVAQGTTVGFDVLTAVTNLAAQVAPSIAGIVAAVSSL